MSSILALKKCCFRLLRIISLKKGVWGRCGKKNRFAEGTIIYEACTVGSYNYFAPYTLAYNAVIGNYCSIGPGCRIGLAEHDIHAVSTRACINNGEDDMILFDLNNPSIIGNDVWLGSNVVVKQGVSIGDGAIVGANAVVIEDIPAFAVAVGIPARVKSYRFSEERIKEIIESDWYMCDLVEAKSKCKALYENGIGEK